MIGCFALGPSRRGRVLYHVIGLADGSEVRIFAGRNEEALPRCYRTHQTIEEGERVRHGAVGRRGKRGFTLVRGATRQRGAIEGTYLGAWWGRP